MSKVDVSRVFRFRNRRFIISGPPTDRNLRRQTDRLLVTLGGNTLSSSARPDRLKDNPLAANNAVANPSACRSYQKISRRSTRYRPTVGSRLSVRLAPLSGPRGLWATGELEVLQRIICSCSRWPRKSHRASLPPITPMRSSPAIRAPARAWRRRSHIRDRGPAGPRQTRLDPGAMPSIRVLALQLRFLKVSESMGNHDSKIVDAGGVD
jgi:hypothetical protein